ncbi:FUSC family protein [Nocardioides sp. BGMRC 2183]|nr:FUSC family protein [Nocardioides sp. BGMRC 2183]
MSGRWRGRAQVLVEELRHVGPPPVTVWGAVRAGVTLLIALTMLWSFDALDLGAAATFGSFAGIYGGAAPYRRRWRLQVATGGLLVAAVATSTLIATGDERAWWAVAAGATWAAIGAAASDRFAWRPPGPLFLVFAATTCASVPVTADRVLPAIAVCAATAAFAVGLAVLEVTIEVRRGAEVPVAAPPMPSADHRRLQVLRCAAAVAIAGALMTATGWAHPYWAMVAAVAPLTAFTLRQQVARGLHRVLGTLAGVLLAGLLLALPLPPLGVILVVAVLQALTELVVTRNYGVALVLITPLALLVTHLAHPEPLAELLGSRLLETVAGAAVGLSVAVLTRARPAARAVAS